MIKAFGKIHHYYSVLGFLGVIVFLWAKLSGTKPLFKKKFTGIKKPFCVRIGTTDASVCKQVFIERHYEFPLPIAPKVIVDAGANIGCSAVFFANKYPDAIIFALEPDESNFKLLERNSSDYPQIKPVKAALWKKCQQICLVDPNQGDHGFQTMEKASDDCPRRALVQAITLDSLIIKQALGFIDILKIDIEGSEKEVFENSAKWISNVGVIMAELHDNIKAGCSSAFVDATKDFHARTQRGEIVIRLKNAVAR